MLKKMFFGLVYLTGRFSRGGGITILSYHSIDDYGTPLSVSPGRFAEQMRVLVGEGCNMYTMSEVGEHLASGKKFAPRALAITFDDGFANLYTEALPVLQRYGLKATVYVITGMVGKTTEWADGSTRLPSLPILNWEQICALQAAGVEIGAHSITHGFMTQYSDKQLGDELREPKIEIEKRVGQPVGAFAYPQGDYDGRVVRAVRQAGYLTATTVDQERATGRSDRLRLPRILVSNNTAPAMMRAFTVASIGPAYGAINLVMKRALGRSQWPRRKPGDVQSSRTVEDKDGASTP
jgi:peptidoglycan/xylan/chitin deacetylase (PgdA/CDA1 family)